MKSSINNDNPMPNASTPSNDMEASLKLETLLHQLFHKIYLKNRNSGQQTQGKVLKILYRKGQLSQKEVQNFLEVRPGTISEIITKLEKKGLVIRIQDSEDRRKVLLTLTEKGRLDVEAFNQNYQNHVIAYFNILTKEEKNEFIRILQKLQDQEIFNKETEKNEDK